jgi:hypothetical protein
MKIGLIQFIGGSKGLKPQFSGQIPFGYAQGRLSTSLRFAQDDSSRVMQSFGADQ